MSELITIGSATVSQASAPIAVKRRRHKNWPSVNLDFTRTASFRLALIYAIAFGISFVIMSFSFWQYTAHILDQKTETQVRAVAKKLAHSYRSGGLIALAKGVGGTVIRNVGSTPFVLLVDMQNNKIAGNLGTWPALVINPNSWYHIRLLRHGRQIDILARYYRLPHDFRLLVGLNTRTKDGLIGVMQSGMASALIELTVLCLLGAAVVRAFVRRATGDLSAVVAAITQGDLSQRVRQRTSGHEFDQIAIAINQMLDRLSTLMDGVKNVSNSIAHDLRTPITRVRVRLEDAAMTAKDDDQLRLAIQLATNDLDTVTNIFQALVRIAEVESGLRRSAFCIFDLIPILLDLVETYELVAEDREIRISSSFEASLFIMGDNQMIQQAVVNLISNAIKFSPPGSVIRVSGRIVNQKAHIEVQDQGPGIPQEDRERATERFYRAESARHTPGSGLGLALVVAVCTLHNGLLQLNDSFPGLRATIILPRC